MGEPNQTSKDDQAALREKVIKRLQEEAQTPLSPSEIREQMASYIASEMDDYPRSKIDEYLNKNYGETST